MSRVLLSVAFVAACLLGVPSVQAQEGGNQELCPKEEIMIFGSSYGYSSLLCKKTGEACAATAAGHILLFPRKVVKLGCKDSPDCNECKTDLSEMKGPAAEKKNWVYRGRQIFLDTTNGVSKLKSLGFARVTGEKADTYFAIFEIRVAYTLNKKTMYYLTPVAVELIGNPGIPGILEATQKADKTSSMLEVKDAETDKVKSYNVVVDAGGGVGIVEQADTVFKAADPMPAAKATGSGATPTPAGSGTKPSPVEDKK